MYYLDKERAILSICQCCTTAIKHKKGIWPMDQKIHSTKCIYNNTVNSRLTDTSLLQTSHYYGHDTIPQLNKTIKKWLMGGHAITDTRYYEHPAITDILLLLTSCYYGHDTNPQLNKTTKKWLKGASAIMDTRYCVHQSAIMMYLTVHPLRGHLISGQIHFSKSKYMI